MKKTLLIMFSLLFLSTTISCNDNSSEVKIVDINLTNEEYAYVVKQGNVELIDSFNNFLVDITNNGTFDNIVSKYFEDVGEKTGVEYVLDIETTNDDNTFVVATNCPFSPFEYVDSDGLMYGIDVEIAKLYADLNGLNLVVKNIDFDAIFTNVDSGYADIGMAGITITEERESLYDFTVPYYQASQKLIVSKDNIDFDECNTAKDVENVLNNLNNQKIGYQIGTTGNWYVVGDEDWGFSGFNKINPQGYKTAQLAIQDIVNGQLYGVIVDEAPAISMVEKITINNMNWSAKWDSFINAISKPSFQELIVTGLLNTILIAIIGLIIGTIIGTVIAIIKVAPKYKLWLRIGDKICEVYTAIFRGTPIVVQLLLAYYVLIPILGIKGADPLTVGIIVFGLNSGAYVSEIMRSGINSIDKGQLEAGRALGLSYKTTMIKVVIPQAIKNILPTIGNEFISLIKETSVVSFITVVDLYTAFNTIGTNTYEVIIPYLFMAIIYILLVVIITLLIKLLEKGLAKSDRSH